MRDEISRTKSRSCSTIRTHSRSTLARAVRSSAKRWRSARVSPAVGSSSSTTSGSSASTIASSSACFNPWLRKRASSCRRSASPEVSSTARAAVGSASVFDAKSNEGRSCLVRATPRQSATLKVSNTEAAWNLRPSPRATMRCGGRRWIDCPMILTDPSERSPPSARHRINVVLPTPLGPTRLTSSPQRAENDTSERTDRLPKLLDSPATSTTTSCADGPEPFDQSFQA